MCASVRDEGGRQKEVCACVCKCEGDKRRCVRVRVCVKGLREAVVRSVLLWIQSLMCNVKWEKMACHNQQCIVSLTSKHFFLSDSSHDFSMIPACFYHIHMYMYK